MGLLGGMLKKGISDIGGEVTSGISKGIKKGVSEGIGSALGKAVESAARPAAEKLAEQVSSRLSDVTDALAEAGTLDSESRSALKGALEALAQEAEKFPRVNLENEITNNQAYYEYDESDPRTAEQKIADVLKAEFPQYEVRTDVSPTTIGGTGRFMNYSFGVYDGGMPILFIMMIGKNTCSTRLYRWSKEQAAKAGVKMINFISHYPNHPGYIAERLHLYI